MMKETLRIRHYVMGILYHAGNASVQILSSRELAARFGIARSTVSLALKELIDEGFLIPKRGIGNFTNPKMFLSPQNGKMPKLIGVVLDNGRSYYISRSGWVSLRATCDAVIQEGYNLRSIPLSGVNEDEIFEEILSNKVDALIWIDNLMLKESLMKRLADAGLPVICDNSGFSQVDTVVYDTDTACYEIGREFINRNVSAIFYNLSEWFVRHDLRMIKQAYRDAGKECRITLAKEWEKSGASLEEYFRMEKRGVIISNCNHHSHLSMLVEQCHADFPIFDRLETFSGKYVYPHEERARIMLARLRKHFLGKTTPEQLFVPMKFIEYQQQMEVS